MSKITWKSALSCKITEAVVQRCSVKKAFQTVQNPQENTCTRVYFSINMHVVGLQPY